MSRRAAALLLAAVVALAGCGDDTADTVTVSAAASLTGPFTVLADEYEDQYPDMDVRVNFGASSALAQQVLSGAPVDVFAAASAATMETVTRAGKSDGAPVRFARNVLEIAVPRAQQGRIRSLADLGRPGVKVALCAPEVPCGAAADALARLAGVPIRPVTREPDVKAVVTKVALGEVDAGLVYRTDVLAAGDRVAGVPVPGAERVANDYLVTVVVGSRHRAEAHRFVALLQSERGRAVLREAGFGLP